MGVEQHYTERYRSGDTPWDVGGPDFNLIDVVDRMPVAACNALDIGCGTGDNTIWLARKGFAATGVDTSEIALDKARAKAAAAGAACGFLLGDFLRTDLAGAPFGFVFDRGCFHSFDADADREMFARRVAAHLGNAGLWLTIAGSADDARRGPGPPRRTAGEIVRAVEPLFEILSLSASRFGSHRPDPPRAWRCVLRKREAPPGT